MTPEDSYPVWGRGEDELVLVPMFLLYDYSWGVSGYTGKAAVEAAIENDVLSTDELLLSANPYSDVTVWCQSRVDETRRRIEEIGSDYLTILINHFPLKRQLLGTLKWPSFSPWCGTQLTEEWATTYQAKSVVYGHLHIPGVTRIGGVDHIEVSLGYPGEWSARARPPTVPTRIADSHA